MLACSLVSMVVKAVGFDFFGTIAYATADSETCIRSMYAHLRGCGYAFSYEDFVLNYRAAVSDFRRTRNDDLREVNNCVWVASALERLGLEVERSSPHVVCAVERYFSSWRITLAPDARAVLEELKGRFTVCLVSNFTDSRFIRRCLVELGIGDCFAHVVVSDSIGWRKPHPNIFKVFLDLSKVKAEEAVYVGDEVATDVKGARGVGIWTVLLAKEDALVTAEGQPDHVVHSLMEFKELIMRIA